MDILVSLSSLSLSLHSMLLIRFYSRFNENEFCNSILGWGGGGEAGSGCVYKFMNQGQLQSYSWVSLHKSYVQ